MSGKPKQPQKPGPQFDVDPVDDEEQPPFTLDDDGNMVLRRSQPKAKPKAIKSTPRRRPNGR